MRRPIMPLPDDLKVEYRICFRVDEPWTWRHMTHQHFGTCVECQATIVYLVDATNPTNPRVKKICGRCAARWIPL
jgi:hypothetical protein